MSENVETNEVLYAEIVRRFASFLIDTFVTNILFLLGLFLINLTTKVNVLNQFYSSYTQANHAMTNMQVVETEIVFGYFFTFAIYVFLCLISFDKTLGMLITGIRFVTSDAQGNPQSLSLPQKFLRGFISNILAFLLLFIPAIAWPFTKEKRSLIDMISRNFVIQLDKKKIRTIISYMVVALFVLAYLYASGI